MQPKAWTLLQTLACWNWKCALLSAVVRSLVYLAAMTRSGPHSRLAVVAVELAYVTVTAGIYAGWQQRALGLRSRLTGNVVAGVAVPALAQILDWLTHRVLGAAAPSRATVAVCAFTLLSALFHLHVMRRGVFLTGCRGRSLVHDFRQIPRLVLGFALLPYELLLGGMARLARPAAGSEAVL
jgi:hypothetical protein